MSGESTGADVEALAEVIERAENPLDDGSPVSTYGELARAVLASDWLAAREAAARAEALREAAAEWEGGPTGQAPIPRWWLEDRADSLATGVDPNRPCPNCGRPTSLRMSHACAASVGRRVRP